MERVTIFIDGSNFYHCLRMNLGDRRIDFQRFANALCNRATKRKLIRVYYYTVFLKEEDGIEKYKDQQRFLTKLRSFPYFDLKFGRLEKRGDTHVEKGVDINIAVDMLELAYSDAYDTAILVSGDGDYVAAVEAIKRRGKHVENVFFQKGGSYHLSKSSDVFISLNEQFLKDCLL